MARNEIGLKGEASVECGTHRNRSLNPGWNGRWLQMRPTDVLFRGDCRRLPGCVKIAWETIILGSNPMSTKQPLSDSNLLPVIESVLGAMPRVVVAHRPHDAQGGIQPWKAIEERIASWAAASTEPNVRFDEDGYMLPNSASVAAALQIAARLREGSVRVPLRLGQTANGGINFEWRSGNCTERLTIDAEGKAELVKFEDSKLVSRMAIAPA